MVGKGFLGLVLVILLLIVVLPFDVNTASSASTRAFEEYDMEELPPKNLNGNFTLDEDDRWDIYGEGFLEGNITMFDESLLVIKNANVTINGTIWAMDNSEIIIMSSTVWLKVPSAGPVEVEKQYDGPHGFMLIEDGTSITIEDSYVHLVRHQIVWDTGDLLIPSEVYVNFGDFYMNNSHLDTVGSDDDGSGPPTNTTRGIVMHMDCKFNIINSNLTSGIVFYVNSHGFINNTTFRSASMFKNTEESMVVISNCTIYDPVSVDEVSRATFLNCTLKSCLVVKGRGDAFLHNTSIEGLKMEGSANVIMNNSDIINAPFRQDWDHIKDNSNLTLLNSSFIQELYFHQNSSVVLISSSMNLTFFYEDAFTSLKDGTIQDLTAEDNSTVWLQGSTIEKYELKDDAKICNITTLAITTKLNLRPISIPIELTDASGDTIATSVTNEQGKVDFTLIRDITSFNETTLKVERSPHTTHAIIKADYEKMHEEDGVDIDAEHIETELEFGDYNAPTIDMVDFEVDPYFNTNEKVLISVFIEDDETYLANVSLMYKVDDDETWEKIMLYNTGENLYQNSIPGHDDGTKVRFYIEAEDTCGNKVVSRYYSYTAGEGVVLVNNLILISAFVFIICLLILMISKVLWDKRKIKKYVQKAEK